MAHKKVFTVEYTDPLSACITDQLYDQYCAGQLVDVSLCIEHGSVALHGFLLAAQSDLLKRSPPNPDADGGDIRIDLAHICYSMVHLKSVVDYLYKRAITLDMTNIRAILKLSNYCSLQRLSHHCKQFLLNRIKPSNCLDIWRIAHSFQMPDIEAMALSLIREIFWEVCKDPTLKQIGIKEMNLLMDKVSVPRKPITALEFLGYWLSGNFSERFSAVMDYVRRLVPCHSLPDIISRLGSYMSQDERYQPLLKFLKTIAANSPKKLILYYNSPFSHDEDWVLCLSEKNLVSIYFPTENQWTTLKYETEEIKIIGILGQTVLSWNDSKKQIGIFNLETLSSRDLPPCPLYIPTILSCEYFCTNTGVHTIACSWYGCGFKISIWRYKYGWEKMREMLLTYTLLTARMRVEPCPTDSNMTYILITSQDDYDEVNPTKHNCQLLRYDSLTTHIDQVFASDTWAPHINGRLLCIENTINFLEDSSPQQLLKSISLGKITVKSIIGRDALKVVDIPITVSKRKRPENIKVMADMADNMRHLDVDQFTCYADNVFWLEHVSPAVVNISVHNFTGDDQWIELPPSPLMSLAPVRINIFNRNSILRGGFCVDNEKQLIPENAYPLANLIVDDWKDDILM